ncbi:MAG: DUF86 domain-containing protein [Clostridia bacterium]|nr:DUF86 domain-containing protein [Clostridia bacterium]MDD4145684.1 DUF86 domain-containing protein [Clostridia bacterium]MDD4665190.1 DUF86 domain-containing protein [Clostridia bacterium]
MKNQRILRKIISYIDTILAYTKDVDYKGFEENRMMVEACIFNLSQIGELVNKLEKQYILDNPEVPWFKIRGLRNRIIHDYEGVNLVLIWEVIASDLEELRDQLKKLKE